MTVWFDNPSLLFQKKEVFKFWPHPDQSFEDRINASSRFIIYAICGLYLVKRDTRIIVLGLVALAGLYFLYNAPTNDSKRTNSPVQGPCQKPTMENPMGNVLLTDYITNPQRPPACPTAKDKYVEMQMGVGNGRSRAPSPNSNSMQWHVSLLHHLFHRFPMIRRPLQSFCMVQRIVPYAGTTQPCVTLT